ncbi:MAG: NAD-dependent epimerase/dehydratase family protein [Defluviitaleaceae bacterium]|nr:NAD-dependent epimerase/dehydratase family protein [Defluviitaleaceae bacterium]
MNEMKVLIVGKNSFIGENFFKFAGIKTHGVISSVIVDSFEEWKTHNFENYSAVIFVAGIAHRKQKKSNAHEYFAVNRDLAVAVAEKSKNANVPHFVYLSSMAVYGKKEGEISANNEPNPRHNDYYGTSKFYAENALKIMETEAFKVANVRPPMVYGPNCPGKYRTLEKLSKFFPLVPNNRNKRSIIYIDNLCAFLCAIILLRSSGEFCPQDKQYANTAELIKKIRTENGKKTRIFNARPLITLLSVFPPIKTAFATLYYSGLDSSNDLSTEGEQK